MGGGNDAPLLVRIDRIGRACECAGTPQAYFDEDGAVAIAHDEVDFAQSATIVARHQQQAICAQVSKREILRGGARDLPRCQRPW